MKSIVRIITVVVLVSVAAGLVGAQRDTAVSDSLTPLPESVDAAHDAGIQHPDLVGEYPLNVDVDPVFIEAIDVKSVLASAATVFVVPTNMTKREDLPAIIEDMNIMSRIFDKRHKRRRDSLKLIDSLRGYYDHSSSGGAPEAVYLAGYGCLFFMKVDFPLIAPREVKAEKPKEGVDPVWEQTKRQMHGAILYVSATSYVAERLEQHDAEQVQDLKQNLIRDLKHASNIRHLLPEEQVVLSIMGSVATPAVLHNEARTRPHRLSEDYEGTMDMLVDSPQASRAVMTIRARKLHIDDFAKGKLDFDKFSDKVEVIVLSSPAGLPANGRSQRSPNIDINY